MSDDGTRLCAFNFDATSPTVHIYDLVGSTWTLNSNTPIAVDNVFNSQPALCSMSGNGKAFMIGYWQKEVYVYSEAADGSWSQTASSLNVAKFISGDINYDGTKILISDIDNKVKIWDTAGSNDYNNFDLVPSTTMKEMAKFGNDDCVYFLENTSPYTNCDVYQKINGTWTSKLDYGGTHVGGFHISRDSLSCLIHDDGTVKVYSRATVSDAFTLSSNFSKALWTGNTHYDVFYSAQIANGGQTLAVLGQVYNYDTGNSSWVLDNDTSGNSGLITFLSTDGSRLFNSTITGTTIYTGTPNVATGYDHIIPIAFDSNNDITIENALPQGDTDNVTFAVSAGKVLRNLVVSELDGTTPVNYTLSSGQTITTGAFDASGDIIPFPYTLLDANYKLTLELSGNVGLNYKITGTQTTPTVETIEIFENVTMTVGSNSSSFATTDADYSLSAFVSKMKTDLSLASLTYTETDSSGSFLTFPNGTSMSNIPAAIFSGDLDASYNLYFRFLDVPAMDISLVSNITSFSHLITDGSGHYIYFVDTDNNDIVDNNYPTLSIKGDGVYHEDVLQETHSLGDITPTNTDFTWMFDFNTETTINGFRQILSIQNNPQTKEFGIQYTSSTTAQIFGTNLYFSTDGNTYESFTSSAISTNTWYRLVLAVKFSTKQFTIKIVNIATGTDLINNYTYTHPATKKNGTNTSDFADIFTLYSESNNGDYIHYIKQNSTLIGRWKVTSKILCVLTSIPQTQMNPAKSPIHPQ